MDTTQMHVCVNDMHTHIPLFTSLIYMFLYMCVHARVCKYSMHIITCILFEVLNLSIPIMHTWNILHVYKN